MSQGTGRDAYKIVLYRMIVEEFPRRRESRLGGR